MHIRHYAQRQHIVDSLDGLLYQLHVLSYFMAPSLLVLFARCFAQLQISRPRTVDVKRNLRFWYMLIVLFNIGTIWSHATVGTPEGRAVILDFIGMAVKPSKAKLLFLDFSIIFLSYILATISFEASYIDSAPEGSSDTLAPTSSRNGYESIPAPAHTTNTGADALVLDLRVAHLWKHIRSPPPPHDDDENESTLLPMPATSAALPRALRALMQARAARTRRQTPQGQPPAANASTRREEGAETRRVPGAMDDPD